MPRHRRMWVSEYSGSYHIISRVVGGEVIFGPQEKEYFLELLERFAMGFFVSIHSFCIMGNHFHILATGLEDQAFNASEDELLRRYRLMYGKDAEPPQGSYDNSGNVIPDPDNGIERLRERLGSISRFVQELKQTFSRRYNKAHNRTGYLWSDRFKGIIVYRGEAQLVCSSYIDLNPVRAGLVTLPEDYRWSSLGLRVRSPSRANRLLTPLTLMDAIDGTEELYGLPFINPRKEWYSVNWYREFVYVSGGIEREGKARISQRAIDELVACNGYLGVASRLGYRIRNFSEGLAIGGPASISRLQKIEERKHIQPRLFLDTAWAYTTRVLRL